MARRRTRQVKGHRRGAVYVKPYCRRPPSRRRSGYDKAREWGILMASRCGPPKTVSVQGYWRVTKRRRTHPTRKTPEHYWTVTNGLGQACGHHHRTLTGAVACRRRHERAQRVAKARYGRSSSPGLWRSEKR